MDDLHRLDGESSAEPGAPLSAPYTIDRAIAEAVDALGEIDATIEDEGQAAAHPSSRLSADKANVQYWIWTGRRLVPASPEASERALQREELEKEELRCLQGRQRLYRLQRRQAAKSLVVRLIAPLRRLAAAVGLGRRNLPVAQGVELVASNDSIDKIDKMS